MPTALTIFVGLLLVGNAWAQVHLSFSAQDGWLISADLYKRGDRGVVLVHGGRFTKERWQKQARELVGVGFRVLAIDLRGFGQSKRDSQTQPPDDGQQLDVLAAVRYLRQTGSKTVSVVGGSMGGVAAAEASAACAPDEIDRVAMIASEGIEQPEKMKGRKLFITCRDDLGPGDKPSLDKIREHYRRAPEPKELVILTGIVAANKKVKQAQCAHNVGEFGLAVQVFVTDNHVYPLVVNPKYFKSAYPEHQTVWTTALQGILARGDLVHPNSTNDQGEGIWVCPAASRPDSFPDSLVFVSYGYNDDGLSTRETSLGLGGQNIWPGRPDGSFSN